MKKFQIVFIVCIASIISLPIVGCISTTKEIQMNETSQVTKVSFNSESLGKDMRFNIYLPNGYNNKNKYPVLYLIHGYTDNEDKWMPILNLKEVVDTLIKDDRITPLIIVMPQIDNSFGINTDRIMNASNSFSAGMYEDYLYKDLIPYIDKEYRTIKNKNGRYIGGLSMGGFAALHLAFIHTDLFSKVGGHSPAFISDTWLFPSQKLKDERNPINIASRENLGSLKVWLDCGDKDHFKFYVGCEQLFTILQDRRVSSEYHLNDGEHNDAYWKSNSEKYLLFYAGK